MQRGDVVLFDLGGVLLARPVDLADVARLLGLADAEDTDRLTRAVWSPARDAWDAGGSAADYYAAVAARLGVAAPDAATLDALLAAEHERWRDPEPVALRLLRDLGAAGYRTGILSNAPPELPAALDLARASGRATWATEAGTLAPVVFSGDLGLAKPDPLIYAVAAARAGVAPARITFLDDKPANVEAARRAGWRAFLWRGPSSDAEVRAALLPG